MLLILITHLQWLLKFGSNDLLTILHLFKHLFHELLDWFFTSVNLHWFCVLIIIAANNFNNCSQCTFDICRILLGIIRLAPLYLFSNGLKICVDHKWHRHLLVMILEFQCILTFFWYPNSLLTVDNHTIGLVLVSISLLLKHWRQCMQKCFFSLCLVLLSY